MFIRRNPREENDEPKGISYWQSMADLLSGILLIFILLAAISAFYSWKDPETEEGDTQSVVSSNELVNSYPQTYGNQETGNGTTDYREQETNANGGGGGGGGGDTESTESTPGDNEDPRAAVRLILIDGTTGKTIPREGVDFELLDENGARETLYTHYPVLTKYHDFETTSQGDFYLPEMIPLGKYRFHMLTAMEGYDRDVSLPFSITTNYTWADPFIVNFIIYHERVSLEITLTDKATGAPLSGVQFTLAPAKDDSGAATANAGEEAASATAATEAGEATGTADAGSAATEASANSAETPENESEFRISAAAAEAPGEDAVSAGAAGVEGRTAEDGSYQAIMSAGAEVSADTAETAATVTTDADGKAVIHGLTTRKYMLIQDTVPEGYASLGTTVVDMTGVTGTKTLALAESMTRVNLTLRDALRSDETLAGAEFELQKEGETAKTSYTTDENGTFSITGFEKNASYTLTQTKAAREGYRMADAFSIDVDEHGLIAGRGTYSIDAVNEINRVSFYVRDLITERSVETASVAVRDEAGKIVRDGLEPEEMVEGMAAGEYRVTAAAGSLPGMTGELAFAVEDGAEATEVTVRVITLPDYILGGAILVAIFLLLFLLLIPRMRKRKGKSGRTR
ncbi:MAG: SpaA isopeptide-forming pilin-related protein [Lachnospiraceae bacterium]|nr:SpaA isopeptide-forming pilin-related protein [Lachnospiraceae bacterium]